MKTILITGSTDGIGKIAAKKFAKEGHTLIVHGRNLVKLETVINEIKEESNNTTIKGFIANFSDINAVQKMADEISEQFDQIDILINNAGVFMAKNPITAEGLDIRFVVNYLAPYVLTNALISLLQKSNSPRVINLSSAAQDSISFDAFQGTKHIENPRLVYGQSKLAILLWSVHFAKKHQNIVSIALNPGSLLNTNMVAEAYGKHWSSADKGANIIYDLALSDEYSISDSGKYFDNDLGEEKGNFNTAHPDAYNEGIINKLLSETDKLLTKIVC